MTEPKNNFIYLKMQTTFEDLLSSDNTARKRAEAEIDTTAAQNPASFAGSLLQGLSGSKVEVAQICCSLLKKYFLDKKAST